MVKLPPLSLYIHIPWCVQNARLRFQLSRVERRSAARRLRSASALRLDNDVAYAQGREVKTIFIGGGTPSLLSGLAMKRCWTACVRVCRWQRMQKLLWKRTRTVEADCFVDYQRAGVNRISIGVQSFSEDKLKRLGRIHGPQEAKRAAKLASGLGLRSFNLDLMHGLPD
ncbi:radical SAM protein [Shigella flexneri]